MGKTKTVKKKATLITVTYSSNNSGGSWWLKDKDWLALEKAGWEVDWKAKEKDPLFAYPDGRWLGALATCATKKFKSLDEAVDEWESITGQSARDLGCECCGRPHSFCDEEYNYYGY